jgi:hypothetical protein
MYWLEQCYPAMVLQNTARSHARKCGQESNICAKTNKPNCHMEIKPYIDSGCELHFDVHVNFIIVPYEQKHQLMSSSSSSSSIGATTLGFWPALRFCSTIFYLCTSFSSFSLSSLDPLLLGQAISVLVFLLVLMSVVLIRLLF